MLIMSFMLGEAGISCLEMPGEAMNLNSDDDGDELGRLGGVCQGVGSGTGVKMHMRVWSAASYIRLEKTSAKCGFGRG